MSMKLGIYWYSDQWGGADTHLSHLLLNWPNKTDQIIVFYNHNNLGYKRVQEKCGHLAYVRFERFQSWSYTYLTDPLRGKAWALPLRAFLYFFPFIFYFIQYRQCLRLFSGWSLDGLISDNGGYPGSWNCLAAIDAAWARAIPKRILLIHHGAVGPSRFRGYFDRWIDRRMKKTATEIIAVSRATYRTLQEERDPSLSEIPHRVIYNGIEIKEKLSLPKSSFPYARPQGRRWLAVIGRIESYKGHEDIVEAVRLMKVESRKELGIVFIGNGKEEILSKIKNQIADAGIASQFSFTGYVRENPETLIPYFDGVLVATRDFEGFGLSLAEGMAQGKPVIATTVGAIPEFIKSPQMGLLIPPRTPSSLAEALEDFVENPQSWNLKGLYAHEEIKNYSSQKMGERFFEVFQT